MRALRKYIYQVVVIVSAVNAKAQQTADEVFDFLIKKQVVSQKAADSLRADYAIRQQDSIKDKSFKIDLEFRPRGEYRDGFQQLPTDTTVGAAFVNQRSRLLFTYEQQNKFVFHTSIQDVRVWGRDDPRSNAGTLQVFEAYAEPFITPNFSIRIGRQKLAFDNQRLFAENDWRVNAGSHEALNLRYNSAKLSSELAFAFNQTTERLAGTDFMPVGFSNYKTLGVHYIKYRLSDNWALSAVNAADGYQDSEVPEKIYQRFTDGGRIEFAKGGLYTTFIGYYQSGKSNTGKNIAAWYVQPEIKYIIPQKLAVRLGLEIFSGDDNNVKNVSDHNFVPLYGVAHRFNGSLELFNSKPKDFGNAGLINPYLFIIKNIGKKAELRSDFHLFYSQNNYVNSKTNGITDRYLGYENDWLFIYRPNSYTKLDVGVSYAVVTESLVLIKKAGNSKIIPTWAYVSITFKPQLFKAIFK
ncbi:MAG: alginate export family protein [Bacteroidetes bacterium]|nr:alginate export family protein [Bacteroidota bacterium]